MVSVAFTAICATALIQPFRSPVSPFREGDLDSARRIVLRSARGTGVRRVPSSPWLRDSRGAPRIRAVLVEPTTLTTKAPPRLEALRFAYGCLAAAAAASLLCSAPANAGGAGPAASSGVFASTTTTAVLQPDWLGKPAANRANPTNGGNAEGNWWTPSSALDTDCDGNKVTARTTLSKECIYAKKTAEIRARQAISEQNAKYKVEKLAADEKKAEERKAKKAAEVAELKAKRARYAGGAKARTSTVSMTAGSSNALPPLLDEAGAPCDVSALRGKRVAFYFSAGWCPMCTSFEPSLLQYKAAAEAAGNPVSIIYVPSDRNATDAARRCKAMGFLQVPFDEAASLKKQYNVWAGAESFQFGMGRRSGVPALVVLDEQVEKGGE